MFLKNSGLRSFSLRSQKSRRSSPSLIGADSVCRESDPIILMSVMSSDEYSMLAFESDLSNVNVELEKGGDKD